MMPRQPVGVKPNTVPNPAVGATCAVAQSLEDERAAVHLVQLPFRLEGQFYFFERATNDYYFYVFPKTAVHIRIGH